VALFDVVRRVLSLGGEIAERARLVVMPILNPDAFAANMDRLERGWPALQRKNGRGVDLNRNFPSVLERAPWNPLAGSRFRLSPYYRGPHPFSEPETRAVRDVVTGLRPVLSLGFHSFGNMLLYPWAWSRDPNPRFPHYSQLATAFQAALGGMPYRCKQASAFYPTVGDLDDWLDAERGTPALTVEVGGLDRRLLNPLRLINPFCWMNPTRTGPTISNLSPGVLALLGAALA
jgi:carboxypeptidase T